MKYCFLVIIIGISVLTDAQMPINSKIDSLISIAEYDAAGKLISSELGKASGLNRPVLSNRLAEVQILQGNLEEAENTLKTIGGGDSFTEAVTKTNLGFLYLNKARNDLALDNL